MAIVPFLWRFWWQSVTLSRQMSWQLENINVWNTPNTLIYLTVLGNHSTFEDLETELKRASTWKCVVTCSGFTDENQTEAQDSNICLCMDSSHVLLKKPIHSNSGFRFDPNKFKGGDEETTTSMQTYLVEKCREQGFYLRPTINCKRTKRGKRLATLDFVCDHNAAPVRSTPSVAKSKKLILPKSSFFFFLKY